ncbi:hypothetical protein AYI69_g1035 [Smittium culicis]|uniref:Uncharacterized protein n=1 Tax=Smittium culicis TaxID=133412 RepID=A0A1R1YRI7_9FUNG|nr:hypothetical protein AYI69_g1035 [Smittium culicis]
MEDLIPYDTIYNKILPSKLWRRLVPPYPTNKWWLFLVMDDGKCPIYPLPYAAIASKTHLSFWYPDKVAESDMVYLKKKEGLVVYSKSEFIDRRLIGYEDLSATFSWFTYNSEMISGIGEGYMNCIFLKGSP